MPLHLLGKKSWNVYNPANIARVKADEAAAAAREAADDQRRQELDAARRAALLRGQTPPPLPEEDGEGKSERPSRNDGRERKRRKLAGEDDTDMDIRLATSTTPKDGSNTRIKTMHLRKPDNDAPLQDTAGHINLFPIDMKEVMKREKNAEAEKEKKKKQKELEDQYTMRFSNAAGRGGVEQPWYTSGKRQSSEKTGSALEEAAQQADFNNKDVWGNEDPRRKEREKARIKSSDPLAFMQMAQVQLKRSKDDRKKWTKERERELRELKESQDEESREKRHRKRKTRAKEDGESSPPPRDHHSRSEKRSRREDRHRSREEQHSGHRRSQASPSRRSPNRSYYEREKRDRDRYVRRSPHRHDSSDRHHDLG